MTRNSQPATVTSYGRFMVGKRGGASLRLNDPDWLVELESQHGLRRHFDGAALGQHLRQRASSCAGPAPIAAPFPPPAIAPIIAPSAAPPPVISAVRLFAPTPDLPFCCRSTVLTIYSWPSTEMDCKSRTRSEAPRIFPPLEADRMTIWAFEPRGMTTLPSASRTSSATSAA